MELPLIATLSSEKVAVLQVQGTLLHVRSLAVPHAGCRPAAGKVPETHLPCGGGGETS